MSKETKKYTTFFSAVKATKIKTDGTFISATIGGLISRFSLQTAKDKKLISASMAVQNRAKSINYWLGTNYPEDSNNPIWVDVKFWENSAERFEHMLNKLDNPDKIKIVLVGSLSSHTYDKNDGSTGTSVTLTVFDWMLNGIPENAQMGTSIDGGTSQANTSAAQTAPTLQQNASTDGGFDFDEDGYFSALDINDDLPF